VNASPKPPSRDAKVLVVDDTSANLFAVSALLEELDCEVVTATSGDAALRYIVNGGDYAVMLLDVMMPGMDGFETLAKLKRLVANHHPPVILLTAYDLDQAAVERAYQLGAVDYVRKPVSPMVLRGKVSAFIGLQRATSEVQRRGAALVAKDRHIAMLAHDIRNPLGTATIAAQLLRRFADEPAKVTDFCEKLTRALGRMNEMVRDLLDYAHVGAGSLHITPVRMDIGQLCGELIEEFLIADPGRSIALACEGDLVGEWDRARIYQALSNLVGNATRYGQGKASMVVRRTPSAVELEVHNDGPPIPSTLLPTLFEPFERGVQDGTGLGLGLYIVREVARLHGGDVVVTSSADSGTTFTIRLPILPHGERPSAAEIVASHAARPDSSKSWPFPSDTP
jgi:two-component system, sensor histidine kinase and response regulator